MVVLNATLGGDENGNKEAGMFSGASSALIAESYVKLTFGPPTRFVVFLKGPSTNMPGVDQHVPHHIT